MRGRAWERPEAFYRAFIVDYRDNRHSIHWI